MAAKEVKLKDDIRKRPESAILIAKTSEIRRSLYVKTSQYIITT
jgi:hypothetical protein